MNSQFQLKKQFALYVNVFINKSIFPNYDHLYIFPTFNKHSNYTVIMYAQEFHQSREVLENM